MDVSKLTISPETLRFKKMSAAQRSKLRRQNMIDLIRSKPCGTPIKLAEFAAAASLSDGAAYGLLNTMVKKGIISKNIIHRRKVSYSVNGEVNTVRPPRQATAEPAPVPSTPNDYLTELKADVMMFYWVNRSDNLHEFVDWIDKRHG